MLKTYSESKTICSSNCDMNGVWRLSDILSTTQEVSGVHSELLGVGRDVLIEKNIVWVLSRSEVVMDRYPRMGEKVTIETFPMNNRRWFFPRYFVIYDADGNVIGRVGTLWVLMDFVERKMVGPDAAIGFLPDNSDLIAPLALPGNIDEVEGETLTFERMPAYNDIDVNRHVNNTRYADWLCDAIGIDGMAHKEIDHLLIHYSHEILPQQKMNMTLYQNPTMFRLVGEHGGNNHFEMGGTFRPRK